MIDVRQGQDIGSTADRLYRISDGSPRDFSLADWVGKRLLAVTHSALGSMFEIGQWVPLRRPVANQSLPDRLRRYRGSEGLLIMCPWDFLSETPVEMFLTEPAPAGIGLVTRDHGLDVLVGRQVVGVRIMGPHRRLYLGLEGDVILRLFPGSSGVQDKYSLRSGDHWWSVECEPPLWSPTTSPSSRCDP